MSLVKKKKNEKRQYARDIYNNNLSLDKKTKGVNMHMENIGIFLKKEKTRSVNMLTNDIEIFLEIFNLLWKYKK